MASKLVSMAEVRKQAAAKSNAAWIVVKGKVYDFTDFAKNHPGGAELLTKNNGKDATEEFVASHPEDIIARTITPEEYERMYIGDVDPATVTAADVIKYDAFAEDDGDAAAVAAAASGSVGQAGEESSNEKPTLDTCLNLYDFEAIASRTMKQAGWAYYSSGADDEITLRENHSAFHRIWLKPRVMVNVKAINMESTVLGHRTSLPLYLSAAAMCKLGHPDGECAWTRAAGSEGVIQMIPTLSSCSLEEIMDARIEGQTVFFQLYVNSNRDTCQRIVEKAERLGCTAMFITCDAPQLGNREKDRRVKVSHSGANVQQNSSKDKVATKSEGTAKALTTFIDPSLNWADIEWFRSITNMRIVLKGIATAEDALLAVEHKIPAIVLSNHGGRQLDFARSGIEILPEVMAALHARGVADQLEVFVDGGVRRGTDIFKALAMGAKAVGLSRPALYAMSAFGQPGVEKMIRILKDELEMTMRLMGTPTIADIREDMVVTTDLARHNTAIPRDFLQHETYLPKTSQAVTQKFRGRRTQNARAENYVQSGRDNAVALGGEVAALRREIRELKDLVADVARAVAVPGGGGGGGGRETRPSPFSPGTVLVLLSSVLLGLARSVFVLDSRLTIHRTALVLLAYLVVHVAGILSVFGGAEAFNANTNLVHGSRLVKVVEYYLLLAFVLHVGVALYRAYTTKVLRGVSQNPVSVFKRLYLMMSGLTLLAFVVVHLQHFRFNAALDSGRYALEGGVSAEGGGSGGGSSGMDFYRLLLDTFADGGDTMVAGYVVSVVVLGVHLYFGWTKAVHKMRLDAAHGTAQYLHPVRQLGYALTVAVTAGFVVAVLGARAAAAARGGDGN